MGLGKTLTMLGAIVYSKQVASEVAYTEGSKCGIPRLTKGTLVVLPSRRRFYFFSTITACTDASKEVLDVWNAEIEK
jgi:hypothetical protein